MSDFQARYLDTTPLTGTASADPVGDEK